jgi:hypothetical protein
VASPIDSVQVDLMDGSMMEIMDTTMVFCAPHRPQKRPIIHVMATFTNHYTTSVKRAWV